MIDVLGVNEYNSVATSLLAFSFKINVLVILKGGFQVDRFLTVIIAGKKDTKEYYLKDHTSSFRMKNQSYPVLVGNEDFL